MTIQSDAAALKELAKSKGAATKKNTYLVARIVAICALFVKNSDAIASNAQDKVDLSLLDFFCLLLELRPEEIGDSLDGDVRH